MEEDMNEVIDYITSLDWSQNWIAYLITVALTIVLGILVIKFLINKVKQFFLLALIALVASIMSYTLFLAGVIDFDILSLIGSGDISQSIQDVLDSIIEWFSNVFLI
jgi:CHASE2 domain-containing sensor protein